VVEWYERKTGFLLDKYGPGPRVHYHTGLAPPDVAPAGELDGLRRQIVASQEAMLDRAAAAWDAPAHLAGAVLDIGCGLGGAALYLAEKLGTRVTALTPVPGHVTEVARLAAQAGLAGRVRALRGDAHALEGLGRFDAALALGATNYFDRPRFFAGLATLLPAGGRLHIEDTFLGRPELAPPFNDYWSSNVGWLDDYDAAAARSGFVRVGLEDVTRAAAGFWRLSVAYSELLLAAGREDPGERRRSIRWQQAIYDAYLDGGFRDLLVTYERR
jgi:tocopherol O-methyltransferase